MIGSGVTEEDAYYVEEMTDALRHRGPDRQKTFRLEGGVLGHARLAVLDLTSAADQPLTCGNGRFSLVFNGEIYNYRPLRLHLEQQGVHFCSQGDAEVLLHLTSRYGPDCLPRLNGMFAFALWDAREKVLLLARDRFGQKPLFYTQSGEKLFFASEVSALFKHREVHKEAHAPALLHYLSLQSIPAPLTAFENIYKLPPGCYLQFSPGNSPEVVRYTDATKISLFRGTDEEAEEELACILERAVARHLLADVPVGLFLSGGVDSSLITAVATARQNDLRSFCIGFENAEADERFYAAQVADMCGTVHSAAVLGPDFFTELPSMVRHYGEPFADSSAVAMWLLAQQASRKVVVALSGDGGDELFNGYTRHLDFFTPVLPGDTQKLNDLLKSVNKCPDQKFFSSVLNPEIARYYFHITFFEGTYKQQICNENLRHIAVNTPSIGLLLPYFTHGRHALDAVRLFETDYYLASTLMPKTDIAAMAHSLEVRAPLLDSEVADFALSLPVHMRMRCSDSGGSSGLGMENKYLLKMVACRRLPDSFVYRRKHGFGLPLNLWLRGPLRDLCGDALFTTPALMEWIHMPEVHKLYSAHMSGQADHGHRLWALVMLALWLRYCLHNENF